jgi:hypothetical protein
MAAYGRYPPTYSAVGSTLPPPASNGANGRKRMLLPLNHPSLEHALVEGWGVSSQASTASNMNIAEGWYDNISGLKNIYPSINININNDKDEAWFS